jgi:hypothetical protein
VNQGSYLQATGVELLSAAGQVVTLPYDEIKLVCFVRDFDSASTWADHRFFSARPKMGGLWTRVRFHDGEELEGMLPNDLLSIDSYGFTVIPPDPGFQNQKLFLPRTALRQVEILGVVGSPLRRPAKTKPKSKEPGQIGLFDEA